MSKQDGPKTITAAMVKRMKLEGVRHDDHILTTNGVVLVLMPASLLAPDALALVLGEYEGDDKPAYSFRNVADRLTDILPDWVTFICPQAGGLLRPVLLQAPEGKAVPSAKKLLAVDVDAGVRAYVPAQQAWLIRNAWPTCQWFAGNTLSGVDLFGSVMEKPSPLLAITPEDIVVGAVAFSYNGKCDYTAVKRLA